MITAGWPGTTKPISVQQIGLDFQHSVFRHPHQLRSGRGNLGNGRDGRCLHRPVDGAFDCHTIQLFLCPDELLLLLVDLSFRFGLLFDIICDERLDRLLTLAGRNRKGSASASSAWPVCSARFASSRRLASIASMTPARGTYEPGYREGYHLTPFLVSELFQKWLQKMSKVQSPNLISERYCRFGPSAN
ncbi:hypothetical protein [Rhizobium leguminosarum]|uniref:hypothetical protein n=1 Tax=Rhizobium leguminosarum TaxID=384 RepID=UPI001DFE4C3D|nr:hypothetical protein [Rhizobium leguminosarum]MBP2447192.1 hypothetical protein [Rhizobium leguminosarum]